MAYTDYVAKDLTITSEDTVVDMQDFVDHVGDWLENRGYRLNEKTYLALPGNKTQIKWEAVRKADDYHKFEVAIKFDLKAKKEAKGKKKLSKGNVKFVYGAKMIRDYDNKWVGAFFYLSRAIYDRFIAEKNESDVLKELKRDLSELKKLVKQYLVI